MSDSSVETCSAPAAGVVEDEPPSLSPPPPPPSRAARPVGWRRREGVVEEDFDADFVASVRAAAAVAFDEASRQPPQQVYVALARELTSRGIHPDPSAVFDAAMLISRGRPPAVLRQAPRGRHQQHDPA